LGGEEMNLVILKDLRKMKKIKQREMADCLGITQSTYHKLETGVHPLKVEQLPIIAKKLGVPVTALVDMIFYAQSSA
jgi:transcriptional regulator with XRE-family HTH domain